MRCALSLTLIRSLQDKLKRTPLTDDVTLSHFAAQCEGWTGADLGALCTEAAMLALRRSLDVPAVASCDFAAAISALSLRRRPIQ